VRVAIGRPALQHAPSVANASPKLGPPERRSESGERKQEEKQDVGRALCLITDAPAPIGIANAVRAAAATWRRSRDNHHRTSTVIDAAIVAVAAAPAVGAAMPAGPAAAGDRNGYSGLHPIEWRSRHSLGADGASDTNTEDQCKGKKSDHFSS